MAAGPAQIEKATQKLFAEGIAKNNGYLLGGFGQYGTDYTLRAVVSQIGLGAFVPHQAIYAMSWSDYDKKALSGSTSYVLHMQDLPPTNEGWSLTVYDLHGALVSNPLNRYAFSNSSQLARNSDGSIDFYLQATEPTSPARASAFCSADLRCCDIDRYTGWYSRCHCGRCHRDNRLLYFRFLFRFWNHTCSIFFE